MSKKICVIFGHHNTKTSFNSSIRDTFIDEAKKHGHEINLINLHEEKQLNFFELLRLFKIILNNKIIFIVIV